jgi:hypothetical protein
VIPIQLQSGKHGSLGGTGDAPLMVVLIVAQNAPSHWHMHQLTWSTPALPLNLHSLRQSSHNVDIHTAAACTIAPLALPLHAAVPAAVEELHARAQREVGSSLMPGLFDHWLPMTDDHVASLARLAEALNQSHPQQVRWLPSSSGRGPANRWT